MNIVLLDFHHLERLSERDGCERWLKAFTAAGLVRTAASTTAAASELSELSELVTLLWSAASLEDDIAAGLGGQKLLVRLPQRSWIGVILVYFCLLMAVVERAVFAHMAAFAIAGIVATGLLLGPAVWVGAVTWSERRRARQQVATATLARQQTMTELRRRLDALKQQPFAFRSGHAMVINSPDLRWVESELRRQAGSEQGERRAQLQQLREQLRDGIQAIAGQEEPELTLLTLDHSAARAHAHLERLDGDA